MTESIATLPASAHPVWRRSPLTVAGLALILLLILIAVFAPLSVAKYRRAVSR